MILNCVGKFDKPVKDINEEARHITARKWSPGADTWQAVYGAGPVTVVENLSQFLGLIEKQRSGSIQRINLLSHGKPGLVAFSGRISAETGDVYLDSEKALNLKVTDTEPLSLGGGKFQESYGAIALRLRNRFSKDAEIVFYLCNSGVDLELVQAVADAFQVVTKGFRHKIWFCPDWSNLPGRLTIDRSKTTLDESCESKKKGIAYLTPDTVRHPRAGR